MLTWILTRLLKYKSSNFDGYRLLIGWAMSCDTAVLIFIVWRIWK